jgi:hypothetical protein
VTSARPPSRLGPIELLLVVLVAGLHALLFWIERVPAARRLWGDEVMYRDLAARWARGEAPEIDPLWPPLYVWFLGLFEPAGALAPVLVIVVQIAFLVSAAWALCALGELWTGSLAAGRWAAALFLLDPQVAAFGHYFWPEALHLALFLVSLWLLGRYGERWWALLLAGLLLGVALLTKSLLLPFLPLLLFPLVTRRAPVRGLLRAALVLLVAAVVVLPTVLDQGRRHGVYAVADSSRFNLWVGLNDRSRKSLVDEIVGDEYQRYRASGATLRARNERLTEQIATFVRERGLLTIVKDQISKQYFRLFDKDSFLTAQLPGGAISAYGFGYVDTPSMLTLTLRAWSYALYALVLVAAAIGVVRLGLRGRPWLWVALLFVAGNLLLFLGLHVKSRYRLQFLPFLDLYAGFALAQLSVLAVSRGAKVPELRAGRAWTGGLLLAALLLFLAFA